MHCDKVPPPNNPAFLLRNSNDFVGWGHMLPPLEPVLIDDAYFHGFGPPRLRFPMKLIKKMTGDKVLTPVTISFSSGIVGIPWFCHTLGST